MTRLNVTISALVGILLSACTGTPTPSGPTLTPLATEGGDPAPTVTELAITSTVQPTEAVTILATPEPDVLPPSLLIYLAAEDGALIVVDPTSGQVAPFLSPLPNIFPTPNTVAVAQGKVYATSGGTADTPYKINEITPAGIRVIEDLAPSFGAISALATDDSAPLLAFGTLTGQTARLIITPADGGDAITVTEQSTPEATYFLPIRWSADGARLYYSEEIPFVAGYGTILGGFSSLYHYEMSANEASVLIPLDVLPQNLCLDDLSPDETMAAHHCADEGIGIIDIANGHEVVAIRPPAEVSDWAMAGSARFSPDSTRIAFVVVRGDSNDEQGWVLVTDALNSTARLVATSESGDYFTVEAWLDSNTLILQSHTPSPSVWLLRLDGSDPVKLSDGLYLDLMR